MDKFEKVYLSIMSNSKNDIIKEDVDQKTVNSVIELLTKISNGYAIPGKVKKLLDHATFLLSTGNRDMKMDGDFNEKYVWEDKVIKICKDKGESEYYFIINDPKLFDGEDYVSYDNASEFDNETGTWETYKECLQEAQNTGSEVWNGFDFNNFKKVN